MGTILFFDPDSVEFSRPADAYPAHVLPHIPVEELEGTRVRFHQPGHDGGMQLFEVEVDPGVTLAPHSHAADEIIAVISGELQVGRRRCGPGSSMLVPADTLYSVRAGPEGCRFLNFRGSKDLTYFSREQHLERLRPTGGSPSRGEGAS